MGYRTCYYRTFNVGGVSQAQIDAYKRCREWLDAAIELVRPGMTTDRIADGLADSRRARLPRRGDVLRPPVRPRDRRRPVRAADDLARALARRTRSRSRTGWSSRSRRTARRPTGARPRASRRRSSSRATGCEVITRFPAEELLVAGRDVRARRRPPPRRRRRPRRSRESGRRLGGRRGDARVSGRLRHAPAGGRDARVPLRAARGRRARRSPARSRERAADVPPRRRLSRLDAHGDDARRRSRPATSTRTCTRSRPASTSWRGPVLYLDDRGDRAAARAPVA